MNLLVLPYPVIDPIALELGPVSVRWYGLAYMAGLLLGWFYIRRLLLDKSLWRGNPAFSADLADDLLIWTTVGVVVGGRLGHVLLYSPTYFLNHPLDIFAVWQGGMSFHGGLLGCGLAFYLFGKRHKIPVFSVMDVASAAVPIGLFFGRIANFINAEIVGKVSNVPWAMVFPGAGPYPRHPTQLYEAILEGLVLFFIIRYFTHTRISLSRPGETVGVFLMGYGIARILAEFTKDTNHGHLLKTGFLTPGMAFCVPMVLLGVYFYRKANAGISKGGPTKETASVK